MANNDFSKLAEGESLAQTELEKEGIDDFYEGYRAKYAAKCAQLAGLS